MDNDGYSHIAIETLVTTDFCLVAGEVASEYQLRDPESIVRGVVRDIGYRNGINNGFDADTFKFDNRIHEQSDDIRNAVGIGDKNPVIGAGDQGMMYGYATNETPALVPLPILTAHDLCRKLSEVRKSGRLPWLRPDGKSQVTVEYHNGKPARYHTVVIGAQHHPDVSNSEIRAEITKNVIIPECHPLLDGSTIIHVNSSGRFVTGGPSGDTGVTGRKIIADTYGGVGRHGGGAFSGKDPTKVDRSGAYMARHIAKNIVAAGLADRCEVQLAYAIGLANPVSVYVDTFGTGHLDEEKLSNEKLSQAVQELFPLTPAGIIGYLNLREPIYRQTATYGHFGRNEPGFPWEKTNRVENLHQHFGLNRDIRELGDCIDHTD